MLISGMARSGKRAEVFNFRLIFCAVWHCAEAIYFARLAEQG
jgi:hypothetical protein